MKCSNTVDNTAFRILLIRYKIILKLFYWMQHIRIPVDIPGNFAILKKDICNMLTGY